MSLPTNPAPPRGPRERARRIADGVLDDAGAFLDGVDAARRWLVVALPTAGRALAALATLSAGIAVWQLHLPWLIWTALLVLVVVLGRRAAGSARRDGRIASALLDPLAAVRADAARQGGGSFIGLDADVGGIVHAPSETAVLVIAPPRRGKTTSVVIPTVLTAAGPVVSTSTKPDVLLATGPARSRFGTVWAFDPTGLADLPDGVLRLRWSPLDAAGEWGAARRTASAMVGASPAAKGTRHESHWTSRAAALLGPLLYAAALAGSDLDDVVSWVLTGDTDNPASILSRAAELGDPDAALARQVLAGVERAADQERQSIWSATADVIDVYTTTDALEAARRPNWDPHAFVRSGDTVYITAPAEHQASVAPLVVALIEAVRDAQYARHRLAQLTGEPVGVPVTLALDEVANVAPLASLPALVSEAGGQGLHVLAAIQDLSQVRERWGSEIADGFLSLFQHVLVIGGVRDTRTLEALSVICGEWDRPLTSTTSTRTKTREPWHVGAANRSVAKATSTSTTRQRVLPPGEVYGLESGRGLHLHGSSWRMVRLAAHFSHPRWIQALSAAPAQIVTWDPPSPRLQRGLVVRPAPDGRSGHPAYQRPKTGGGDATAAERGIAP